MNAKKQIWSAAGLLLALLLSAGVLVAQGLSDYELSGHPQRDITFTHNGTELSGTLVLPSGLPSAPVLLLVHGDGPQDRFASGGYLPLMNALLDNGIGVYTWDKPGIAESTGDWLRQSMNDRATEALTAHQAVQTATKASGNPVGFLGFSQAGWVLPKVATRVSTDTPFILIGGATSWKQQGAYFATVRLTAEGYSQAEVSSMVQQQLKQHERLFEPPVSYEHYLELTTEDTPMSEARYGFVARNYAADSTHTLSQIQAPMLVLYGEDDLNVDARREAVIYQQSLADNHPANAVVVWPDATHSLLKSRWFNHQLPSQIPWYSNVYALMAGRHIYAPGVIDRLAEWFLRQSR